MIEQIRVRCDFVDHSAAQAAARCRSKLVEAWRCGRDRAGHCILTLIIIEDERGDWVLGVRGVAPLRAFLSRIDVQLREATHARLATPAPTGTCRIIFLLWGGVSDALLSVRELETDVGSIVIAGETP